SRQLVWQHVSSTLLSRCRAVMVGDLAFRKYQQDLPQVVTVVQVGEAVILCRPKEAVEYRNQNVFRVDGVACQSADLGSGQRQQTLEVAPPDLLGSLRVLAPQAVDQPGHRMRALGNRLAGRHDLVPSRIFHNTRKSQRRSEISEGSTFVSA